MSLAAPVLRSAPRSTRSDTDALTDAVLVARIRSGDCDAFAELYRLHAGAVHAAVRDNVHTADAAADVVQETFSRALARLHTLRQPDRFRPWLLSIARHAAVDARRHRTRVGALGDDAAAAVLSTRPDPEEVAEVRDLAALLETGMAALPPRDATALSLVTHLGFGPAEVAAALGVTPGAAKVIVHRARRRLRDVIALQVLVRADGAGCGTFEALCGSDELVTAARHVKGCELCQHAAQAEVSAYGAMPAPARAAVTA